MLNLEYCWFFIPHPVIPHPSDVLSSLCHLLALLVRLRGCGGVFCHGGLCQRRRGFRCVCRRHDCLLGDFFQLLLKLGDPHPCLGRGRFGFLDGRRVPV